MVVKKTVWPSTEMPLSEILSKLKEYTIKYKVQTSNLRSDIYCSGCTLNGKLVPKGTVLVFSEVGENPRNIGVGIFSDIGKMRMSPIYYHKDGIFAKKKEVAVFMIDGEKIRRMGYQQGMFSGAIMFGGEYEQFKIYELEDIYI